VASFGFRGEALSSLCEIAGAFEVTTRVEEEAIGARIVYDR
jgi:DNA mismatch repair protein PMS2